MITEKDNLRDEKYKLFLDTWENFISGDDDEPEDLANYIFNDELNYNNADITSGQFIFYEGEILEFIEMYRDAQTFA